MEIVMLILFAIAGLIVAVVLVQRHQRIKRREAHDAEILAASEAAAKRVRPTPELNARGPWVHRASDYSYRRAYTAPSAPTSSPQQQSSGMDPLMAGAIGYLLASSGNSHASEHHHSTPAPDLSCRPSDGGFGGAGASSSYESSSSSDSSSSYDSGSSSSDSSSSSSSSSD